MAKVLHYASQAGRRQTLCLLQLQLFQYRDVCTVGCSWYSQHAAPTPHFKGVDSLSVSRLDCPRLDTVEGNGKDKSANEVYFDSICDVSNDGMGWGMSTTQDKCIKSLYISLK